MSGIAPVGRRLPAWPDFNQEKHRQITPWDDFETFTIEGLLAVATYPARLLAPRRQSIYGVIVAVDTAPTGDDLIVDLLKNGTTIFTNQGRRPRVPAGENASDLQTKIDRAMLKPGDYLQLRVAQVGSSVPGADLTCHVFRRFVP